MSLNLKRQIYFFTSFIFIIFFTNCTSEEFNEEDYRITKFEQEDIMCNNDGGIFLISFTTNAPWKASTNSEWCELSLEQGDAGSQDIRLRIQKNGNYEDREAIIRIECGTDSRTLKVNQKKEVFISTSLKNIELESKGGTFEINVKSNIEYTCNVDKDWLTISPSKSKTSLSNKKWIFNVTPNHSQGKRKANISFLGEGIINTVIVEQKNKVIPESFDFEENGLFYEITSIKNLEVEIVGGENVYNGEIIIPNTIKHNGKELKVIGIKEYAFYNSNVSKLTIGNNVSHIGRYALYGTKITSINVPESVTKIDSYCFDKCYNLSKLVIEDGDNNLVFYSYSTNANSFFSDSPIKELYLGRSIEHPYSDVVFANLSLVDNITLGPKVSCISNRLFEGASHITTIKIPSSVTSIKDGAFNKCFNLKSIIFEDGKEEILYSGGRGSTETGGGTNNIVNYAMFCDSPLEYIYLGRNFKKEDCVYTTSLFEYTPIKNIEIGKYVTLLVDLENLRELKELKIPKNVKTLQRISGCTNLRSIKSESPVPPTFRAYCSFDDAVYSEGTLYVPKQSVDIYKATENWKNFFQIRPITE